MKGRALMIDPEAPADGPQEAHPEAAAILRAAGWKPHDGWGVYTRGTLVMGFSPDGQHFDVKNYAAAPDGPDTPNDPVEAARWLVRLRAPAVVIDDVVSYEPPTPLVDDQWPMEGLAPETRRPIYIEPPMPVFEEAGEAAYGGEDETHGETGESDAPASEDAGPADEGNAAGLDPGYSDPGRDGPKAEEAGVDAGDERGSDLSGAFDADFAPIEDEPPERDALDADLTPLRGIAWDENTVADELGAEIPDEGRAPQDRFIGLDDLDRVRKLRIGDVAAAAAMREAAVEAAVSEREGEHQALTSFVVTNLDKYTGAFTLQDTESLASYQRWLELDRAGSRKILIDRERKAKTAFLLNASREEVVAFDPEAGWP